MKYIICILFLSILGCNPESGSAENKLDVLFDSTFNTNEPGAAVLISKEGKIIYQKGFGIADIKTEEKITANTLFNVGSISKTFVAYGILLLAIENKLSLDDNLYQFFPDFKDSVLAKKVTLKHLLTHSSGLPDIRNVSGDSIYYLTAKDEENWAPIKQANSLEFEPGEKFNYSNPAFNGLALIIEKVSGMKWQNYIRQKIMLPAGMKTSTITDGPHPETGVSHGYLKNGNKFIENDYGEEPTFAASGNGGVWSSVTELWNYEQAIQNHIFLDNEWINNSRTVATFSNWGDTIPPKIGLSWFVIQFDSEKIIGHTGSQGGFRSDYVWIPKENVFYVILCNTPKPLVELRKSVLSILKTQ